VNVWFADAHFFIALLNKRDRDHPRALAIIHDLTTDLLTTPWVLAEVADGVAARDTRGGFLRLLKLLRSHRLVTIKPVEQADFDLGVELYAQRGDKDWTLTDCISFVLMRQRGITEALTGDHHFEQAGFVPLLK
jgi:hypothetical protein